MMDIIVNAFWHIVELIYHREPIIISFLFVGLGGAVWLFGGEETKVTRFIKFCFILLFFGSASYAFYSYEYYEYKEDIKKLKSEQSQLQELSIRDDESGINKAVAEPREII